LIFLRGKLEIKIKKAFMSIKIKKLYENPRIKDNEKQLYKIIKLDVINLKKI